MAAASAMRTTVPALIPAAFSKVKNQPISWSSSRPIRTCHQPQDRQGARPHHPGNADGHGGRGDPVELLQCTCCFAVLLLGRLAEVKNSTHRKASVDHLVGARDQRSWKGEAEGFGRFEIDGHSEFRGQLDR
jgi:hypothetical protein